MFSASQLSEDQKNTLRQWAAEGASIADLQKRMKEEMEIGITYMDARFLVLDLGIEIIEEKPEEPAAAEESADVPPDAAVGASPGDPAAPSPLAGGAVQVSKDSIAVPGSIVSGQVVFSDGERASWMIDEYGRPGLDPSTPGYRPTPEDIEEFQKQLTSLVRDAGI